MTPGVSHRRAGLCALLARLLFALFVIAPSACKSQPEKPQTTEKQVVTIAAASDLKFALREVVAEFKKARPLFDVQVTYGSSGNFHSQLTQGAPFDLFLSADVSYPDRLIQAGVAAGDTRFIYAVGRLAVWASNESGIDPEKLREKVFTDARVRKIAIANPEHAPYGKAAVRALEKLGVHAAVKDRLVLGENVAQAAQFVESGAADLGIIALSLALAPELKPKGKYWELPLDAYPRMEQGGAVMSKARHPEAAREFRAFLSGNQGAAILRRNGFFLPDA